MIGMTTSLSRRLRSAQDEEQLERELSSDWERKRRSTIGIDSNRSKPPSAVPNAAAAAAESTVAEAIGRSECGGWFLGGELIVGIGKFKITFQTLQNSNYCILL